MSESFVPGFKYPSASHELWALLGQLSAVYGARASGAASAVGLSPVSAWALIQLEPGKPISQKDLAERLHCSPSTVVDPTDRLEAHGLVVRQTHSTDRRINVLVVTPAGRKVRDKLISQLFRPPEPLNRLSPRDQTKLRDLLLSLVSVRAAPKATSQTGADEKL